MIRSSPVYFLAAQRRSAQPREDARQGRQLDELSFSRSTLAETMLVVCYYVEVFHVVHSVAVCGMLKGIAGNVRDRARFDV